MKSVIKSKWGALALIVTAFVFTASLFLRPMWRDEFWALYFSGLGKPLPQVIEAISRDVHPPLYFVCLHFWRMLSADPLWIRAFNVAVIAAGAAAAWGLRGRRSEETLTFMFLCATSYWMIFYGVEARMMGMEFVLCALNVLVVRNTLDNPQSWRQGAAVFFLLGVLAASAHFFGALWFSVAGAWTGLALLKNGRVGAFLGWGVASAAAIAPVVAWIAFVRPDHNPGAIGASHGFIAELTRISVQFFRGLIIKTLLANLAATAAAVLCLRPLLRRKDPFAAVIFLAAVSATIIPFALHLLVLPSLIKERAFIVMMPAVIYLIVEAMHSVQPEQRLAQGLIRAVPIVAILSLPLFAVEYFKDRERIGEVRHMIAASAAACAGQPIVAYYRPSEQAEDFSAYFTHAELSGAAGGRDVVLVDAAALAAAHAPPPPSTCPIKALALTLPRGEDSTHVQARRGLRQAGLRLEDLREVSIGKARGLVYVASNP